MALDFWAGYASGALGIIIGSPLDLMKVQRQAGLSPTWTSLSLGASSLRRGISLARGAAAPVLGYGALNGLLFVAYHRSLAVLAPEISSDQLGLAVVSPDQRDLPSISPDQLPSLHTGLGTVWLAGALGGLASFVVSCPTELLKCRAQLYSSTPAAHRSSQSPTSPAMLTLARHILRTEGLRGLYSAGVITASRDAIGYGFYFWAYEGCKRTVPGLHTRSGGLQLSEDVWTMLCGGVAGVATWASIFPLDAVKTRLQGVEGSRLEGRRAEGSRSERSSRSEIRSRQVGGSTDGNGSTSAKMNQRRSTSTNPILMPNARPSAASVARDMYREGGMRAFFAGLGVCSARAFLVNAVQWWAYEALVKAGREWGMR